MLPANANIARHLGAMAAARPTAAALKVPRGRTASGDIDYLALNFAELDLEVSAWCTRLAADGVRAGDRTLVMVRPGLPLIAAVFALFRLGAVPVVLDPGMTLKNFLPCVARTRPRALVGIPLARWISRIFRGSFQSIAVRTAASSSPTARLALPGQAASGARLEAAAAAQDLAAILFTSGSTGTPKGVCYEHGMFEAQIGLIRKAFAIEPGEIDLPILPIFALFNPALGMTTIVPEMDPRRPAAADPAKLVQAIRQEQVTNSFGSPTIWRRIAEHCRAGGITLPSLRRVLCAGAPVPRALWEASRPLLPHGRLHSPYGATEALPVSSIDAAEMAALAERPNGNLGACVGRPLSGVDVRIIALTDAPIATLAEARELPVGEVGEIIVRGDHVTRAYDQLPEATARAKISEESPAGALVWHRMGDCGRLDNEGRLWYYGRVAERVLIASPERQLRMITLYTEPCEQVFRRHPAVHRCALIGLGSPVRQIPALVVEAALAPAAQAKLAIALRLLGQADPATAAIHRFYFRPRFPVDARHNAKIHRLTLARWAAKSSRYVDVP